MAAVSSRLSTSPRLTAQLIGNGLPAGGEGIADMVLKALQIAVQQAVVQFNLDAATGG